MSDRDELYYAEMEAERNNASIGYFNARPHLDTRAARDLFDAGFERAFRVLWHRVPHEKSGRTSGEELPRLERVNGLAAPASAPDETPPHLMRQGYRSGAVGDETEERRCVKCRTSKRMCDLKPLGIQQCCDGCSHPESETDG